MFNEEKKSKNYFFNGSFVKVNQTQRKHTNPPCYSRYERPFCAR